MEIDFNRSLFTSTFATPVYDVHKLEQRRRIALERTKCDRLISNYTAPSTGGPFCDPVWDGIMCWNAAKENTVSRQKCPEYINGLFKKGFAVRTCTENGSWFFNTKINKTWTDFNDCIPRDSLIQEHLPRIRLMYNIGYGVSLCSLVIAVFIMLCTRKLHSKSNTLHINLFLAFILRAFMSFLKESLLVNGLGLEKDLIRTEQGGIKFNEEGTHWECKLFYSVFLYAVAASVMWIFMEALYLYMLVYKTLFTERNGVLMYILLGWLGPLTFIIPWVIVRAELEDELCWNTNTYPMYLWILRGPMLFTTVLNFIFFIDIVRILYVRVNKYKKLTGKRKIRKLAKFIVVLLPLFGVSYIVFSFVSTNELDEDRDIPYLYAEMFYNSFQGFLLALLFCFLNGEVLKSCRKLWHVYALRRKDSFVYTRSAILTSRHTSRAPYYNEASSETSNNSRSFRIHRTNNDKLLLKAHMNKNSSYPMTHPVVHSSSSETGSGGSSKHHHGTCAETNCSFLAIPKKKTEPLT